MVNRRYWKFIFIGICIPVLMSGMVTATETEKINVFAGTDPGIISLGKITAGGFPLMKICYCPFCCLRPVIYCPGPTTVYVIRHADRDGSNDALKYPEGYVRRKALQRVLGNDTISAIYTTNTQRTIETIRPLAEQLKLKWIIYDDAGALNTTIRKSNRGQTVLVVSHSAGFPSVYGVLEALGGSAAANKCPVDDEFDNLCTVTIDCDNRVSVHHLHYGADKEQECS